MQKNSVFNKILLVLILSVPLFFTPFTAFGWHFGKTIIFQILIEILALYTLFFYSFPKSGKLSFNLNWLDASVTLFVFALILTSLTGVNFEQSFWMNQSRAVGVFTWIHLWLMYFLLRVWLRSKEDWTKALQWCLGVGLVVSLTALFQNSLPQEWRGDLGGRFAGILGNPAFFGAYMIPLIGISLMQFFNEKTNRKWMYGALSFWFLFMLVKSGSRGAFGGFLAGSTVYFFLSLWQFILSKQSFKTKKVLFTGLALFVLFGIAFISATQLPQVQRLFDFSFNQQTGQTRLMAWNIAWKTFQEHPIVGVGFGNYEVPFNKYYHPQFFQHGFQETVWDRPHSAPLEMLSSMGIFSVFYFAIFIVAAWTLLKKEETPLVGKRTKLLLVSIFFGYAVTIGVLFDTIAAIFLMMCIFSYISSVSDSPWKKEIDVRKYSWISKGLFVFVVLYAAFLNVQFFRSSLALQKSLSHINLFGFSQTVDKVFSFDTALQDENAILLADQLTKMEKANMLGKANSMYWKSPALKIVGILDEYALRYKDNLSYPMWAAEVYIILGQFDSVEYYKKAVQSLQNAENISPQKQEVKILLARVYLLQKDFENALVTSQKVVAVDESIGHSYYFLALTQEASGKRSDALKSFTTAFEKGYSPTSNERELYLDLLAAEKQWGRLVTEYQKLVENEPNNTDWYVKLATVYVLDGKKKEALEIVEKAVVLYPPLREEAESFIKQNNLR